ncbi:hypothetical protein Taro_027968 [Colocasia esculenta]|uniref:Uncharacterized protein n=1 Tax=Colocasia esculenta TaxID=4460 RepID=A0A843VA27_COLES|nr:hypothetical protein [Colocasia esculenta]
MGNRHNYKCNYYGHMGQGGGVSRLKKHHAGGRLAGYHDVQGCKSVPAEVKRLMIEHLKGIGSFEVGSGSGGSGSRVGGETQSCRYSNVGDYFNHIPTDGPNPDNHQGQRKRSTGTTDGKYVEGIVCNANFWDRVFKLVQIIEPLYEVLRVVDGDRRPSIGLVYAKIEAAKKKIHDVSPRYAHLVLDIVEDRWDRQMSQIYIWRMKSFREGVGSFAEPSAVAGRDRIDGATTERGEYELDEEADDPEDPPCPNTFLARAVEAAEEEEGGDGDVGGGRQPHSCQFRGDPEEEIDASAEDVQMAILRIVRPGCEVWDHFVRAFWRRYNTMMTWDEFRSFVSGTKSYHLIEELPSESDESVQPQWGTYDPYQQGYWGY